jgi:hypothetical protein
MQLDWSTGELFMVAGLPAASAGLAMFVFWYAVKMPKHARGAASGRVLAPVGPAGSP